MQYVSPSDFVSVQSCPARAYLLKNSRNRSNRSAYSYFGSFCHYFIKKSSSQLRSNNLIIDDIKEFWDKELNSYSKYLLENDPNFHLKAPLSKNVKGFIFIKTDIINRVLLNNSSSKAKGKAYVNREESIEVEGISGSIDLVYRNEDYVKLVDFKFGKIFNDNNDIKEEYKIQLYIYAAMYYLENNIMPSTVSLCDKKFNEYNLELPSIKECLELFQKLKDLNDEISNINNEDELAKYAKPNDENCRFCNVKIDCNSYWSSDLIASESLVDFKGKIKNIFRAPGGYSIELKQINNDEIIKISGVPFSYENKLIKDVKTAFLNIQYYEDNQKLHYKYKSYSDIVFIN